MHAELDERILELVSDEDIPDQFVLGRRLAEVGMLVSQPSLSRRLRRLNVVKRGGYYRQEPINSPLQPKVLVQPAPPNLIVLKTSPGYAQAIGAILDDEPLPGQVGTVAGDDTVLVVCGDPQRFDEAVADARDRFPPPAPRRRRGDRAHE